MCSVRNDMMVTALKSGITLMRTRPRSSATLFDRHKDKSCPSLLELSAPPETSLFTTNPRLIHLHLAAQRFPSRVHHRPAEFVQHHPCGLVAGQAQLTLQK